MQVRTSSCYADEKATASKPAKKPVKKASEESKKLSEGETGRTRTPVIAAGTTEYIPGEAKVKEGKAEDANKEVPPAKEPSADPKAPKDEKRRGRGRPKRESSETPAEAGPKPQRQPRQPPSPGQEKQEAVVEPEAAAPTALVFTNSELAQEVAPPPALVQEFSTSAHPRAVDSPTAVSSSYILSLSIAKRRSVWQALPPSDIQFVQPDLGAPMGVPGVVNGGIVPNYPPTIIQPTIAGLYNGALPPGTLPSTLPQPARAHVQ